MNRPETKTTIAPIFRSGELRLLINLVTTWREAQERIVWTNGCFDLFHLGHADCLIRAKSFGERLIVGVNSDSGVRINKGNGRPIVPEVARAAVVSAIRGVDAVLIFDDVEPSRLINEIRPDVHIKGMDYHPSRGKPMPERHVISAYGGMVEYLTLNDVGVSTSSIIQKIRGLSHGEA